MRIVTPQNAAFDPSGGGSGGSTGYTFSEIVTGDFGPTSDAFFTPSNGTYAFYGFDIVTTACGAGNLQVEVVQSGGVGSLWLFNLNLAVLGNTGGGGSAVQVIPASGGPITIERTVTGFAAPNGAYQLRVRAYLLA